MGRRAKPSQHEHPVQIVIPVTGNLVEFPLCHQRCFGQLTAARLLDILNPALKRLDDTCALGHDDGQSLSDHIHRGEVFQLTPDLVVIPALGVLHGGKIVVQLFLSRESRAVHALEHLVLLIALPVSAGALRQPERLDGAGRKQVRSCAQVGELALPVKADDFALRQFLNQLHLVRLVVFLHERDRFGAGQFKALDLLVLLDDLLHLRLNIVKDIGREGNIAVKVIVEAVLDGGTDGQLGFRIQTLDRLRQDMRSCVAENVLPVLVREGQQLDVCVSVQHLRQRAELAVHVRSQYGTTDESRGDCGIIYRQGRIKFHLCGSKIDSHGFLFSPCFRFENIKTPESTALRQRSPGCMIQRSGVTAKGAPGLYHTRFHPKVSLVCGYGYSRRQAKSLLLSVRAVRDRRILREGSQQGNLVPFPSSLCAAIPVGLFRTGDTAHGGCPYCSFGNP